MIRRRIVAAAVLVAAGVACADRTSVSDSTAGVSPDAGRAASSPAAAAQPATVTPAQFRDLRWLEGTWRGQLPDSGYFYERYTRVNDSTIRVLHFPDSTLAASNEEDSITFRSGVVRHGEAIAIRFDSAGIDFARPTASTPQFTFQPAGDHWTATIHRPGGAQPIVYQMRRFGPVKN